MLLVPREHHEALWDLPGELIGPFSPTPSCSRSRSATRWAPRAPSSPLNNVVSQSVPHLHIHVVPRVRKDGLRGFFWPRRKYESAEHLAETAEVVRAAVEKLRSG